MNSSTYSVGVYSVPKEINKTPLCPLCESKNSLTGPSAKKALPVQALESTWNPMDEVLIYVDRALSMSPSRCCEVLSVIPSTSAAPSIAALTMNARAKRSAPVSVP